MAHQGFHAIVDCDFKTNTSDQNKTQAAQTIAGWRTNPPKSDPDWPASVTIGTVSLMADDPNNNNKPGGEVRVEAQSNLAVRDDAHKDFQKLEDFIKKKISDFNRVQHTCCYIDF